MSPKASQRPACICGIGILAILLLEAYLPRAVFWLPAAFSLFMGLVLLRTKRKWLGGCFCVSGVLALLLGIAGQGMIEKANPLYCAGTVEIRGQVQQVTAIPETDKVRAVMLLDRVNGKPVRMRVICASMPDCNVGEVVSGQYLLEKLPKDKFYRQHYADHIFTQAQYQSGFAVEGLRRNLFWKFYQLRLTWGNRIRYYLEDDTGGVLAAMSVGDKSGVSRELYQAYQTAGIPHVLVVSGLHLAVICSLVPMALEEKKSRRRGCIISILLALFFICLTGASPSVVRAGIGVILYSAGFLLGQAADPFTNLAMAGVLMSVVNPYAVCDIGFQLSFCATAGVLLGSVLLGRMGLSVKNASGWRKVHHILVRQFILSCMAALFVIPVQMAWHMSISRFSGLANLACFLLIRPMICCGLAVAVLGGVPGLESITRGLCLLGGILARWLNEIVEIFLHISQEVGYGSGLAVLLISLVTIGFLLICMYRAYSPRLILPAVAIILLTATLWSDILHYDLIQITVMGQSKAPAVVVTQHQKAMVLFRGSESTAHQIQAYLYEQGIPEIDYVVNLRLDTETTCPLKGKRYKTLAETEYELPQPEFPLEDVILVMTMDLDGGMAALVCGQYVMWLYSGSLDVETDAAAMQLLLASDGEPGSLAHCETILTLNPNIDWLQTQPKEKLRYAKGRATVRIRPRWFSQDWRVRLDT